MRQTLIDSGPLVAFYSTRDQHHGWAFRQLDALRPPLLTCEAVLAEAVFYFSAELVARLRSCELSGKG